MSTKAYNILLVDDEDYIHKQIIFDFQGLPYKIDSAYTGIQTYELVKQKSFDVILLDVYLPDVDDLSLLKKLLQQCPVTPIIMISAHATENLDLVIEAIKLGAYDFIAKPINSDELSNRIANLLKFKKAESNEQGLLASIQDVHRQYDIIGNSSEMRDVLKKIEKVTDTDNVVLIQGETGTGKELVARAIHYYGNRKCAPFISVNCSALPRDIVEAELFGYERGAFTGAIRRTPGKFELAGEGSIFLDEIGEISLETQPKLLRVLQDGEYSPLGNLPVRRSRARVVAATNRDVKKLVEEGKFREDLYYRLEGFRILLPPLRTRSKDIITLAHYFLDIFNQKGNKKIGGFTSECLDIFMKYDWPGNIRQLHNVIETCFIMEESKQITTRHLLPEIVAEAKQKATSKFEMNLSNEIKREEIIRALEMFSYKKGKAARYLGIHRNTLRRKIYEFNIEIPSP